MTTQIEFVLQEAMNRIKALEKRTEQLEEEVIEQGALLQLEQPKSLLIRVLTCFQK